MQYLNSTSTPEYRYRKSQRGWRRRKRRRPGYCHWVGLPLCSRYAGGHTMRRLEQLTKHLFASSSAAVQSDHWHQHQCLQSLHTLITMRSCRGNFRSSGAAAGGGASVAPRRAMPSQQRAPRAPRRLLVPPDCQRPLAKESPIELAVRAGLWESVLAICLRTVCCWATCG